MLIALLVIGGIALLTKSAKSMEEATKAPVAQYNPAAMIPTSKRLGPRASTIDTFTPKMQTPSIAAVLPVQLVGMEHADPSVASLKTTFDNQGMNPSVVGMLSQQRFLSGGYK